ncbi:hypothetical protein DKX38_007497 [Salix brachista]|uniref:Uncharacterized protein n=1 Tax=Salix brachista TaxID=2182728 RepID=A0A5N5MNU1_9ROSI|nr:hypothetical protein DKX38_007497 [Salix brachista]
MGCCISSNNNSKRGSRNPKPPPQPRKPHVSTTCTSPPLEEETVKEVLSETPIILKPQRTSSPLTTIQTQEPKTLMQSNIQEHQEISQASEICSNITDTLSTSTTTTTTTITEIREDEATSRKRVNRSPAKVHRKRPYNGDRERVLRYPAKTTGQVIRTASGQPNVGSRGGRSDFGRSPATRTAAIGVGRGRAGTKPGKVTGKAGGRSVERKNKEDSANGSVLRQQPEGNESLENPLVSLECFIFL